MNLRDRVALNIQELRRARGLSQEELAHRADVSRGHMGKVENAKFAASLDLLERIAKALNARGVLTFQADSDASDIDGVKRAKSDRKPTQWGPETVKRVIAQAKKKK